MKTIDEILDEYRKTCFLVSNNLENSDSVTLMALSIINTRNSISKMVNDIIKTYSKKTIIRVNEPKTYRKSRYYSYGAKDLRIRQVEKAQKYGLDVSERV